MALEMSTKIPEVKDVIVKVRELSADEKLRRLAFYREKRLHDESNAINGSIPLGNQTSQWFAICYIDSLDRFIKEKLKIKYYSRYIISQ